MIKEANIEIVRNNDKISSISIFMPVWDKVGYDGFLTIELPLLGIKTFAKNESFSDKSIDESVRLFIISSEKHGRGIETELKSLGWGFDSQSKDKTVMSFGIGNTSFVIDQVMKTGDQYSKTFELELA